MIWFDLHLEQNMTLLTGVACGCSVEQGDGGRHSKAGREATRTLNCKFLGKKALFHSPGWYEHLESGYLVSIPRQGKFIRIHFGTTGKLASADIETCK